MKRVIRYEGTAFHVSTGSSHTATYPFLAEHAIEAGVDLTEAGIPIEAAEKLCIKWNKRHARNDSIRYSYRIPFTS